MDTGAVLLEAPARRGSGSRPGTGQQERDSGPTSGAGPPIHEGAVTRGTFPVHHQGPKTTWTIRERRRAGGEPRLHRGPGLEKPADVIMAMAGRAVHAPRRFPGPARPARRSGWATISMDAVRDRGVSAAAGRAPFGGAVMIVSVGAERMGLVRIRWPVTPLTGTACRTRLPTLRGHRGHVELTVPSPRSAGPKSASVSREPILRAVAQHDPAGLDRLAPVPFAVGLV